MKFAEHEIQKAIVNYVRYTLPDALIFAIPNGGQRSITTAQFLKSEGVLAGIPDLCFIYKGLVMFFEVKTEKGKLTDNQYRIIEKLILNDIPCYILRNIDDLELALKDNSCI